MVEPLGPYSDFGRLEVTPFVPRDARRVLDVGCLAGAFGAALKSERPATTVWGIELRPDAAELAAGRLDHVIVGRFPDDVPSGERFDCVVFNDVLEHLEDPWSALRATHAFLAPGGCVVASIPNVRHYSVVASLVLRGDWRYADAGILDRSHLRFFTSDSATRLFEECGYGGVRCAPINITPPRDRLPRLLHLAGRRGVDFLAYQLVLVANTGAETGPAGT